MQLNDHQSAIVHIRLNWMDRVDILRIMQGRLGMRCYDTDTVTDDFAPSIIGAIENGDLDLSELPETDTDAEKHHQKESDLLD